MNVKEWLKGQEKGIYQSYLDYLSNLDEHPERSQAFTDAIAVAKTFLESLAAERELSETRRALLKKHEWAFIKSAIGNCPECLRSSYAGHTPDCAIATALKGVGGGK